MYLVTKIDDIVHVFLRDLENNKSTRLWVAATLKPSGYIVFKLLHLIKKNVMLFLNLPAFFSEMRNDQSSQANYIIRKLIHRTNRNRGGNKENIRCRTFLEL